MINVIEKIEEIISPKATTGIIGWFKEYKPTKYPAYCVQPIDNKTEHETVGYIKENPSLKLFYIENFPNSDYNTNSKNFFIRCSEIETLLKLNKTLDGLVSKFSMKSRYYTRNSSIGKENVMEISINIDEIM